MTHWIDTLVALRDAGKAAVAVTVASTRGSAPREAGAKLIVTADAIHGTIGGGHLEHRAIAIARDQIAAGVPDGALHRFPLGASLGQCCGGVVNLLFEPVIGEAPWLDALADARRRAQDAVVVTAVKGIAGEGKLVVTRDAVIGSLDAPAPGPDGGESRGASPGEAAVAIARTLLAGDDGPRLVSSAGRTLLVESVRADEFAIVLFGAGHVGRAIVRAFAELPCRITWVDERADEFPGDVPANATVLCTDAPEEAVECAPAGAYFLVMTHSHALDERLTETILRRADHAYLGLIGSATKRRAFEARLARRGVPAERFATMTCPIGIAGIPGKEPGAIAIAVAAQVLQVRARGADARSATTSLAGTRA